MRGNEDGGKYGGMREAERKLEDRASNILRGRNVMVEFPAPMGNDASAKVAASQFIIY